MKRLTAFIYGLFLLAGVVFGQERIVCDETCEIDAETIPTMQQGMTQFLITGDSSRNKLQTMPGGGYSTIKIELPRNWDTLMNELGYQPLYKYRL